MARINLPAPMSGSIKEMLIAAGAQVRAHQEVILMESMKMEIPVEAPAAGIAVEVLVAEGDKVDEGQVLLRIETS